MFRKTLALVLLGILVVGAGTVAYGTFFDKGFNASMASVAGGGDRKDHEGRNGHGKDQATDQGEDEDEDDGD